MEVFLLFAYLYDIQPPAFQNSIPRVFNYI
jgi:hypothetical protein